VSGRAMQLRLAGEECEWFASVGRLLLSGASWVPGTREVRGRSDGEWTA
jgi:hypothetical protein